LANIVTDLGGATIDPGIDEGATGEMYTLRLLSNAEIPEYFTKFTPGTAPYDLVDQVDVMGACGESCQCVTQRLTKPMLYNLGPRYSVSNSLRKANFFISYGL
jgi:hypothetical protein